MINVLKLNIVPGFSEEDRNYIMRKISNTAYIISKGINTDLQLYACVSDIMKGYITGNAIL